MKIKIKDIIRYISIGIGYTTIGIGIIMTILIFEALLFS